jgi:RNA polymerase sigma factor (sigma-70 family)
VAVPIHPQYNLGRRNRTVPSSDSHQQSNQWFATTRWSVVLGAGGQDSGIDARAALAALCETYWAPLYTYLRRSGSSPADAEDCVQGFLASLLERNDLAQVHPGRGRFRSFLLASLKHFQSNQRDRERAQKRGGGRAIVSLDAASAEQRYATEQADRWSPEALFDRAWALTVLERARTQLRESHVAAGKGARFDALVPYLTGDAAVSYKEVAATLATTEGAVKVLVHRLREEFRKALRSEIAQTVASPDDIDAEIDALFEALRR